MHESVWKWRQKRTKGSRSMNGWKLLFVLALSQCLAQRWNSGKRLKQHIFADFGRAKTGEKG